MHAIMTDDLSLKTGSFELQQVCLSIPKEAITTIVGPNGSGKSTILQLISRLKKADKGSVTIFGQDQYDYKPKSFAKTVAMLTQAKESMPNLTVEEIVSFGRTPYQSLYQHKLTEKDREIIDEAMEITNITSIKTKLFRHLSGGEQQRVRIALAIAQRTDILLLDEPTTYLDIAHQFEILELLRSINKTYKLTIVMVLHDLAQAIYYSDYMIAVKDGRARFKGKPQTIVDDSFLWEMYQIQAKISYDHDFPTIVPKLRRN